MDDALAAPRDLTEGETSDLRERLRSELISINSSVDDEEDADVLLDYATDMIESGENVGRVIEELEFMEMPLWDEDTGHKLGVCLTNFFIELFGGDGEENSTKEKPSSSSAAKIPPLPPPPALSPAGFQHSRRSASRSPPSSSVASFEAEGVEEIVERSMPQEPPVELASPSIAARSASFLSSSRSPPIAALPSRSSSRTSWAFQEKNSKNNNPSQKMTSEEEKEAGPESEPEPEPEAKQASLKDRLAAYQGASSKKAPDKNKNDEWLKDRLGASSRSIATSEKEGDKGGDDDVKEDGEVEDAPPVSLSLKERMAAFQGGKSPAAKQVKEDEGEEDAKEEELDTSKMTLKERMAAYQRKEAAPRPSDKGEPTLRDRMSAYQQPAAEKGGAPSLQDRMAVFGKAKSSPAAPKKELTGVQQRMAKFSNSAPPPSSATSTERNAGGQRRPSKIELPKEAGAGLRDRLSKYRETAAPTAEAAAFVAPKKKGKAQTNNTRRSFAAKKPNEQLQARMRKYLSTPEEDPAEGGDGVVFEGTESKGAGASASPAVAAGIVERDTPAPSAASEEAAKMDDDVAEKPTDELTDESPPREATGAKGLGGEEEQLSGDALGSEVEGGVEDAAPTEPASMEGSKREDDDAEKASTEGVEKEQTSEDAAWNQVERKLEGEVEKTFVGESLPKSAKKSHLEDDLDELESGAQDVEKTVPVEESLLPDASQKEFVHSEVKVDSEDFREFQALLQQSESTGEDSSPGGPAPEENPKKELQIEKSTEEIRTPTTEEAERAKAELEAAKKTLEASLDLVASFSKEVEEHRFDVKKAELAVKSAEKKMKKGGLLSMGKKRAKQEALEDAMDVLRVEKGRVQKAEVRLASALRDDEAARAGVARALDVYNRTKIDVATLGADSSRGSAALEGKQSSEERKESETVPFPVVPASKVSLTPSTDEGTADGSFSDEADAANEIGAFLDIPA